jgi:hypothetical protein
VGAQPLWERSPPVRWPLPRPQGHPRSARGLASHRPPSARGLASHRPRRIRGHPMGAGLAKTGCCRSGPRPRRPRYPSLRALQARSNPPGGNRVGACVQYRGPPWIAAGRQGRGPREDGMEPRLMRGRNNNPSLRALQARSNPPGGTGSGAAPAGRTGRDRGPPWIAAGRQGRGPREDGVLWARPSRRRGVVGVQPCGSAAPPVRWALPRTQGHPDRPGGWPFTRLRRCRRASARRWGSARRPA